MNCIAAINIDAIVGAYYTANCPEIAKLGGNKMRRTNMVLNRTTLVRRFLAP
jgi:hypothetical protein